MPRRGEKFWPEPGQVEECRERGRQAVAYLASLPFDVSGDPADLLVPEELEERRVPATVTDAEVAEVAVALSAQMLGDVRGLRTDLARQRRRPHAGPPRRAHGAGS